MFAFISWEKLLNQLTYHSESPIIFTSGLFFFLFLLFLPIYGTLRNRLKLRIVYVLAFSLFFYYKSSGWHVILLCFSALSDFIIASVMHNSNDDNFRKKLVTLSVVINLSVLSYFKYFNFLGDTFVMLLQDIGLMSGESSWSRWNILLPVGISFYTFQTMSYVIDVYRRQVTPLKSYFDYLFYVSFFPQLVAGPIVRAKDFIPQIYKAPLLTKALYSEALALIISGVFKKAIISDYISFNFVDRVFEAPTLYTGFENLMASYGYSLQIYCDFSGYSDIAIGIALLMGFRFNINFDSPYQSSNITEFWRRWHISLSTWLKDYLYIPLGGNRKGRMRTYANLFITMLLGGLWHGAALRFILWGAMHGVALAIHKAYRSLLSKLGFARKEGAPKAKWKLWLSRLITFHFVVFTFIFFRAENMDKVGELLGQIWNNFHPEVILQFIDGYRIVFVLIILGYILHFMGKKSEESFRNYIGSSSFPMQVLIVTALIVLVIQMRSADVQPFIYFQF